MLSNESSLKTIKKIFPIKLQVHVPVFFGFGKGMCKSYTGLMEAPGPKYSFIFVSTPSLLYDTRSGSSPLLPSLPAFPLEFRLSI